MLSKFDLEAFGYYDPEWEKERQHDMTPMDMVKEYSHLTKQEPDPMLYSTLIDEEYEEWSFEEELQSSEVSKHYSKKYSPEDELKELSDLAYVIFGYANARGWDLMEALRRVHQNNLGRCYQPEGTIKRREDGKIIRNPDYPKVNLGDLV